MGRFMDSFSRYIIAHRWGLILLLSVVTILLAYLATGLKINNDHDTWMPRHDRTAQLLREVDSEFSSNVMLFCVIEFKEKGVFHPESLGLIGNITGRLEDMEELFNVTSLTNIIDIKKTDGGVEVGELISDIPNDRKGLDELKDYVLSKEMYVNSIVSSDGIYTAFMTNIESSRDEVVVAEKVFGLFDEMADGHTYYFGGDPAVHYYMNEYMNRDMRMLVPIMLVVMVFVLGFGLRRITGVALPLTLVGLSIIWTFGVMSIFSFPINILSPAVAVLLIALGSDYAVHIYNHYLKRGEIYRSTREVSVPVVMSAMTTIAGLLSFATTKIEVLKNFGIELAVGLGTACILSIVFVAIGIYLFRIRPGEGGKDDDIDDHVFARIMVRLGGWVYAHSRLVIAVACICVLLLVTGITRIKTNVDFIGQLPKDSPPRKGCNILMDHFSGMYPFNIYFRGEIEDPAIMSQMAYLENYLRGEEAISGFTSINSLIAEENWLLNGVYTVPETRQGVANLWFLLEGNDMLKTFVTAQRDKGLVNSIAREDSTQNMRGMAKRLQRYMDKNTSDEIVRIDPQRLPDQSKGILEGLMISHAARQLTWLVDYYGGPARHDEEDIESRLSDAYAGIKDRVDMGPVWENLRTYLEDETIEILSPGLVNSIMAYVKDQWHVISQAGFMREAEALIVKSGEMDSIDAQTTVEGLIKRFDFTCRMQKVEALRHAMLDAMPPEARGNKDFRKRSDGILWEMFSKEPFFFSSQVESVPGIREAVFASYPVEIDQAGMPQTVRIIHELLISSQFQSLIIASVIVLVLVSLTQRSIRRGTLSLISVLVPMEFILSFMGWKGIPLDLGTVLSGALIIGLGIDGSIHFIHYHHTLHALGIHGRKAIEMTMGHVGKAVLTANATTFCGFVVLLISKTTAVRNFSLVNSVAIFMVTLSVLTLLPALMTVFYKEKKEQIKATADTLTLVKMPVKRRKIIAAGVVNKDDQGAVMDDGYR